MAFPLSYARSNALLWQFLVHQINRPSRKHSESGGDKRNDVPETVFLLTASDGLRDPALMALMARDPLMAPTRSDRPAVRARQSRQSRIRGLRVLLMWLAAEMCIQRRCGGQCSFQAIDLEFLNICDLYCELRESRGLWMCRITMQVSFFCHTLSPSRLSPRIGKHLYSAYMPTYSANSVIEVRKSRNQLSRSLTSYKHVTSGGRLATSCHL